MRGDVSAAPYWTSLARGILAVPLSEHDGDLATIQVAAYLGRFRGFNLFDDFSGVLRKDAADEVILSTGPNADVRIARSDISEMRPGKVSVMPQGLNEQLTQQELADLLAFLKATRW